MSFVQYFTVNEDFLLDELDIERMTGTLEPTPDELRDEQLEREDRMADPALATCACGCGLLVAPGRRFVNHHNRRPNPDKMYVVAENGCWVWQGSKSPLGYANFKRDGVTQGVHRWFYQRAKGAIPDGLHLDHLCRNPSCVNPDHLEAVTCKENIRRGRVPKLTTDQVREIRRSVEPTITLAARYSVSADNIRVLRSTRRRNWRDVIPEGMDLPQPRVGERFAIPHGAPVHSLKTGDWTPAGNTHVITPRFVDRYKLRDGTTSTVVTWAGRGGYWRRVHILADGSFVDRLPA